MKKLFCIFLVLFVPVLGFSIHGDKNKNIKTTVAGKVTDVYGEAIPGTKIKVKETGETFYSNFEGQFKLALQADKTYTLLIENLGFEPLELKSSDLVIFSELSLKSL